MIRAVKQFTPCTLMYEDNGKGERPGFWLDKTQKHRCVQWASDAMAKGRIVMHDPFISDTADMERRFVKQLRAFERRYVEHKSGSRNESEQQDPWYYSGKGKGRNDDTVLAFVEGCKLFDDFLSDSDYMAEFHQEARGRFVPGSMGWSTSDPEAFRKAWTESWKPLPKTTAEKWVYMRGDKKKEFERRRAASELPSLRPAAA